ncbi:MAG: DUF4143 domain-containing protein [Bacteroidota bacterium]
MIDRTLENIIAEKAFKKRTTIISGPRQTGKSALVDSILSKSRRKSVLIDAGDPMIKSQLENLNIEAIKRILGRTKLLVIDEAQKVTNIESVYKLINKTLPNVRVIIISTLNPNKNGNNSISNDVNSYELYPISYNELTENIGRDGARSQLKHRLIYGMYPKVISSKTPEKRNLIEIINNHLYKDILETDGIRKPSIIIKLLKKLALQVGKEINLAELSDLMDIDRKTIDNYISKLEEAYVIFRLQPLKRNLKNEIGKFHKIYFYDNGIRNALLSAFNPIDLRNDADALWENFLMSERIKQQNYSQNSSNKFFWRTHARQEINYIEEEENSFSAYDFNWSSKRKTKFPKTFINNYPTLKEKIITPVNYYDFIIN